MNSPKIAFLLGSLNRGGTETLLLDVARNATKNELDAILIYRKTGALESDFKKSGLACMQIEKKGNIIQYLLQLRKTLLLQNIRIAHAQQPIDALLALLACMFSPVKVVLSMHGYDFGGGSISNIMHAITLKLSNANCYVSNHQKNYYSSKYKLNGNKQFIVYNGIDMHKILHSDTPNDIYAELHISPATILMGMVGNFVKGRDPLTVCQALVLLHNEGIDFNFVFVGKASATQPEIFENCVSIIKQNGFLGKVHFLGTRNDVPSILKQLNAFVYSTDHDTFGIAVVEAMASGIPVFANDWPVMQEISNNGQYIHIYESKNAHDLANKLRPFIANASSYEAKAKEAAIYAQNTFSIEKHIANIKALYISISKN